MERQTSPANTRPSDTTEKIKKDASSVAQEAKQQARQQVDLHKETVADQTRSVATAVERVADEFRNEDQQTLAHYAGQMAGEMKNFADNLRGRSVDELLHDTQDFARRNPGAFLLGSVAVGFALSRFVKATAPTSRQRQDTSEAVNSDPVSPSLPAAPAAQTPAFEDLNS